MRLAWLPFFALLLAAEPRKLPEPYQSFADLARSAPPEFGAEALLRLAESGKIPDRAARRDLVEQSFRLAAMAKLPVRMRGVAGTMVDTRSGFQSRSYDLKLDVLSLQSRAVRDMVPLDAAKARELFLQIQRPTLAPLTCDDALVYDVADYYQTLGVIVQSTFTAQERKKEEDLKFLLDYVGQVSNATELAPAARLVKGSGMSGNEQDVLATRFSGLLESIQPDDRSFAATLEDIRREITPAMQASFDKYKQKSEGCRDDSRPGVTLQLSQGPVHAGNTPSLTRYWESGPAKQMLQDGLKLRFTSDGKLIPESARTTREWQQQVLDYLNRLADWTSGQEKSEADYYHQKCIVYEGLMDLIPPGPQRDKTMQAFVDFISASDLQQQASVEWFMQAKSMLDRVHNGNGGETSRLLDAYQNSGNAVLALLVAEEKIFGTQLPSWVTNSN